MNSCLIRAMEWQACPKQLAPLVKATFKCLNNEELVVEGTRVDALIKRIGTLNCARQDFETNEKAQSFIFDTYEFAAQEIEYLLDAVGLIERNNEENNTVSIAIEIENKFSSEQLINFLNMFNYFDVNDTRLFDIELLSKAQRLWQDEPDKADHLDELSRDVFNKIKDTAISVATKKLNGNNFQVALHPIQKILALYDDQMGFCTIRDDQNNAQDIIFQKNFQCIKWHPTKNRLIVLFKDHSIAEFDPEAVTESKKTVYGNTLDEHIRLSVHPGLSETLAVWYSGNSPGYIHVFDGQNEQWKSTMGTRLKFHPREPIVAYENMKDIIVENIQENKILHTFSQHLGVVTKLRWNKKESKQLAYGTMKGEIGVIDYTQNALLTKAEIGHCVGQLAWNEEGSMLAGHSFSDIISVLKTQTKTNKTIKLHSIKTLQQMVWCNNEKMMLIGNGYLSQVACTLDVQTDKEERYPLLPTQNFDKIGRYGDSIIAINSLTGTQLLLDPTINSLVKNQKELKLCYLIENNKLAPSQKKHYKEVYQGMDAKLQSILREYYDVEELSKSAKAELE